jgi:undecaprenyl-diphosphatase
MSLIISIILGAIQGLTEFLPISSSAHLVFAEHLLRLSPNIRLSYDVILHLGTTLALLIFFGKRIGQIIKSLFIDDKTQRQTNFHLVFYIIIGSIPVGIVGGLLKDKIELTFTQPIFPAIFLLITGLFLIATKFVQGQSTKINTKTAFIIGIAQAIALLPGISRSGATIATALLLGISNIEAFEFSFLLSIPAVIGANILTFSDFKNINIPISVVILGIITTVITGILTLFLLRYLVMKKRIYYFGFYCLALGILALILLL